MATDTTGVSRGAMGPAFYHDEWLHVERVPDAELASWRNYIRRVGRAEILALQATFATRQGVRSCRCTTTWGCCAPWTGRTTRPGRTAAHPRL